MYEQVLVQSAGYRITLLPIVEAECEDYDEEGARDGADWRPKFAGPRERLERVIDRDLRIRIGNLLPRRSRLMAQSIPDGAMIRYVEEGSCPMAVTIRTSRDDRLLP
jgi:hypothetical protein